MKEIATVGIISKPKIARAIEIVCGLLQWLEAHGIRYRCDEQTAQYASSNEWYPRHLLPDGSDLVIVLSGDGTLLSAARVVAGKGIPLFAVNLGNLGFLTAIQVEELYPELERVLRGEHEVERRGMADCELQRNGEAI